MFLTFFDKILNVLKCILIKHAHGKPKNTSNKLDINLPIFKRLLLKEKRREVFFKAGVKEVFRITWEN